MNEKLTEKGRMVLNTVFDSLEDVKNNYFPDESEENIILALNAIGEAEGGEVTEWMELFFKGVQRGLEKLKAARIHLTEYSDSHEDWQYGRIKAWKEEFEKILWKDV